jgi:ubiquinone/menaquinone biosynthesis C-methylase UbiE
MKEISAQELYAQLYDLWVVDWPGEVDFYQELITHSPLIKTRGVLEIGCGTGRIALRFAQNGINTTGLDISSELLEIARKKSLGMSNVQWVKGDMKNFEIGKKFGCVIIPGHSFQFMTTPEDQVNCLEQIKKLLVEDGLLIIHIGNQNINWLAGLLDQKEPVFEKNPVLTIPLTGQKFRYSFAWTFEPSTQTASVIRKLEELGINDKVNQTWETEPIPLHCIFRFEMEHLLRREGFSTEAVYGDFYKNELGNKSEDMIWIARKNAGKNN